jgi:trehalose 6-phosphate phosphatase
MTPETAVIPIAASEVAVAERASHPQNRSSKGTITMPPPTPNNALKNPATRPMRTSRTPVFFQRPRRRLRTIRTQQEPLDALGRLAEDPTKAALFLDVDGVLAPIVPRPEDARVPDETRRELRRLNDLYALVACISGRAGADAQQIVGVPELVYVGNHGLELDSEAEKWRDRLQRFLEDVDWAATENKGLTASLHYRGSEDEAAARAALEEVKARAERQGFLARFGRKVLEVLPPLEMNKGTAVRRLLAERSLERALYAGDDTTDLDGFRALDGLDVSVRIAVVSEEGPAGLLEAADLTLGRPEELLAVLQRL